MAVFKATVALRVSGKEPQMHHVSCPDEGCLNDCVDAFNQMRANVRDYLKSNTCEKSAAAGCATTMCEVLVRVVKDDEFFFDEGATAHCLHADAVKCLEDEWTNFVSSTPCTTHSCECP